MFDFEKPVGKCAYCEDLIYSGEKVFSTNEGKKIHSECMEDFLFFVIGVDKIAEELGYSKESA